MEEVPLPKRVLRLQQVLMERETFRMQPVETLGPIHRPRQQGQAR